MILNPQSIKFRINQIARVSDSIARYVARSIRERMHFYRKDEIFSSKYIHLPRGFNDKRKRVFLKRAIGVKLKFSL